MDSPGRPPFSSVNGLMAKIVDNEPDLAQVVGIQKREEQERKRQQSKSELKYAGDGAQ